jgi:predicted transcriptional regulator
MLLDQVNKELELTERHLLVLKKVIEKGPIGILRLAEETEMPTHKVRYSLRILEQENLIKPSIHGATEGDMVDNFLSEFEQKTKSIQEKTSRIREIRNSIEH